MSIFNTEHVIGSEENDCLYAARFMTAWARHMVHSYFTVLVHEPSGDELAQVLRLHARLGFPDCVSMTDGVDFQINNCAVDQRTRAPITSSRAWFGTCILHVSCHSHTPPSVYSVEIVGLTLRTLPHPPSPKHSCPRLLPRLCKH